MKFVQKNNALNGKDHLIYLSPMINSHNRLPETFGLLVLPIAVGLSREKYNVRGLSKSKVYEGLEFSDHAPLVCSGKFGDVRFSCEPSYGIDDVLSASAEICLDGNLVYDGVDYYEVCLAEVRNYKKKYRVSIDNIEEKELFIKFYVNCVNVHKAISHLVDENENKKITILGNESNYIPNSAIWWSIKNERWRNIEYVDCNRGYQKYWGIYFRELGMCSRNVTKRGHDRLYVTRDELRRRIGSLSACELEKFLPFRERESDIEAYIENVSDWEEVFCLYAHVMYDVKIPDSAGEFRGIVEWINDVCEYFVTNEKKLLIIKPHPGEKPNIKNKEPNERVEDVLNDTYKCLKNVKILPPEEIEGIEDAIDCGLVWRSSVGLELGVGKKPVVLCGSPDYEYLPFVKCRNKSQLYRILKNKKYLEQDESLAMSCAGYLAERKERIKNLDMLKYSRKFNIIHPFSYKTLKFLAGFTKKDDSPLMRQIINEMEL